MTTTPPPGRKSGGKIALLFGGAGIVFLFLLCICSASGYGFYRYHNRLTGKWKANDGSGTLEFKSDGTIIVALGEGTVTGTYKTDGNKITITLTILGVQDVETGEYAVSGSELTLSKTDNGHTTIDKFTRQ